MRVYVVVGLGENPFRDADSGAGCDDAKALDDAARVRDDVSPALDASGPKCPHFETAHHAAGGIYSDEDRVWRDHNEGDNAHSRAVAAEGRSEDLAGWDGTAHGRAWRGVGGKGGDEGGVYSDY